MKVRYSEVDGGHRTPLYHSAVDGTTQEPRRSTHRRTQPGHRCTGRSDGGGFHPANRQAGCADVSGGGAAWRRVVIPIIAPSLAASCSFDIFRMPAAAASRKTKFAIFINDGYISLKTVLGKFLCCSVSLASGIALGREGPSVQIGAGIASYWDGASVSAKRGQSLGPRRLFRGARRPLSHSHCGSSVFARGNIGRPACAGIGHSGDSAPPRPGLCCTSCWAMSPCSMFRLIASCIPWSLVSTRCWG